MTSTTFSSDRRKGHDRRLCTTAHPLLWASWRGRRQSGRRHDDALDTYMDRYHASLRYVCLGVLALCMVDAFFTLRILEGGGTELNPVMDYLLRKDVTLFVYIKLGLTALGVMVLVSYFHFRWFRVLKVSYLLYTVFGLYVALVNYQLYLLAQLA